MLEQNPDPITGNEDRDILAEQAVLGAIIASEGRILDVLAAFDASDYFRPAHEELHRELTAMLRRGDPVDVTSAAAVCATIRGLDMAYAFTLTAAVTTPAAAPFHAGRLTRLATLRRARAAGHFLTGLEATVAANADHLDAALDDARSRLDGLGAARTERVTTFADVADEAIDSIGKQQFTPTSLSGVNHLIRGWAPSQMYVLGARPGVGKTVVSVQEAIHVARTGNEGEGMGVAYYTWEMSGARLYQRSLASAAGVDLGKLITGRLSEAEWRAVGRADHEVLRDLPFIVEGAQGWTPQRVVSHAKAAHRKRPLGLVIIDHIGRVAPGPNRRQSREQEVADSANQFLDLAHQLDCAVLVCTQLNREPSRRSDPRPVATDVRESDTLEQNADVLMLLHRDKEKTPCDLDLLVAKNRDGIEGAVELNFEGAYSRATDRQWRPSDALNRQTPSGVR